MFEARGGALKRRLLINDILLAAAVTAVCTAIYFFAVRGISGGNVIEIVYDGVVVQSFTLDSDGEYTVADTGFSVIVSDGIVRVSKTDCSDKICTGMKLDREGGEIVCLPNRIVVRHKKVPVKSGSDISAG